jgi:hypothetical protein
MKEVTIATQIAELNEHLSAIIDRLSNGCEGDGSCSEYIAEIRGLIAENSGLVNQRLEIMEKKVAQLERGCISEDFIKRNALINEVLLSLKGEDRLTLEKLYDLAFGERKSGILYEKLPPDTDQIKHRETLNQCRQAQDLSPRT